MGIVGALTGGHNHTLAGLGVNMPHNAVHILSGALALAAYWAGIRYARAFLWFLTGVYGLVVVGGFLQFDPIVTTLNLNAADNVLHTIIVAAAIYGLLPARVRLHQFKPEEEEKRNAA